MKKIILFITIVILLAANPAVISGESEPDKTPEDRMLNDLLGYIYQTEKIFGDILWTLNSIEKFDSNRSWDNLQIARASSTIALNHLSQLELFEMEMTFDDETALMDSGIDVSFMENLHQIFDSDKTTSITAIKSLYNSVMDDVFLQKDWQIVMSKISFYKKSTEIYLQDLANTADWTLASINKAEVTELFNNLLAEYCPLTHKYQAETLETPEAIEKAENELLDELEALTLEYNKIVGAKTNRVNYLSYILEKGDLSELGKDLQPITDMPPVLFYPEWYDDNDYFYFWTKNDEILPSPLPGTDIDTAPDGCRIRIDGVSKEDFWDYVIEIEEAGLPAFDISEENGKISVFYDYFGSGFAFFWEEEIVTIFLTDNQICFVPRWYLPTLNAMAPNY